jgi:hypothetical protein
MDARVRDTDPDTSQEAAAAQGDTAPLIRQRVRELFQDAKRMTDHTLHERYVARYGFVPESTPRKRRCELRDRGIVADSGHREPLPTTRRRAILWELREPCDVRAAMAREPHA